jgi:hypothetical protein
MFIKKPWMQGFKGPRVQAREKKDKYTSFHKIFSRKLDLMLEPNKLFSHSNP